MASHWQDWSLLSVCNDCQICTNERRDQRLELISDTRTCLGMYCMDTQPLTDVESDVKDPLLHFGIGLFRTLRKIEQSTLSLKQAGDE